MALLAPSTTLELKTYDDLIAMPDDGNRYELLSGEIVMSPAPKTAHQRISMRLSNILFEHVFSNDLGEVFTAPIDVRFSEYNVVQPDLVFVSNERDDIVADDCVDGPPDLVVEILSPSTRVSDLVAKSTLYAASGVAEYWIVDPDTETIAVFQLVNGQYQSRPHREGIILSSVLPGVEAKVAEVFAKPNRRSKREKTEQHER
jgi:Uma2 family endonuclease